MSWCIHNVLCQLLPVPGDDRHGDILYLPRVHSSQHTVHTGNVWGVTCEWGDDWQLIQIFVFIHCPLGALTCLATSPGLLVLCHDITSTPCQPPIYAKLLCLCPIVASLLTRASVVSGHHYLDTLPSAWWPSVRTIHFCSSS